MLNRILLVILLAASINIQAVNISHADTLYYRHPDYISDLLKPTGTSYHTDVVPAPSWRDNWFVSFSGGTSAFIGSPLGCEDLFGRLQPVMNMSVGKWIVPSVGVRAVFQGFRLKNSELHNQGYRSYHADLLWNPVQGRNPYVRSRFDVIPYIGFGWLHNTESRNNPFAFSYGVIGRYRVLPRLHLTMELGGTSTFKNFDGYGSSDEFGDHLLNLTAGVSFTIGANGWKRVADARPYIIKNRCMADYIRDSERRNGELLKKYKANVKMVAELKKILEIDGLLGKYESRLSGTGDTVSETNWYDYPKNSYSGLDSLRKRLGEASGKHAGNTLMSGIQPPLNKSDSAGISDMSPRGKIIGAPVHFFFIIGTANLTDRSQLVNVDEIARVANKYNLLIRILGTADNSTGNETLNKKLGADRASHISDLLVERGVPSERIDTSSKGGISDYAPDEANRQTSVELYVLE